MRSGRFAVLIAAFLVTSTLVAPAGQAAAPHTAAPPQSGSTFTPVPPTRVFDDRTGGKMSANSSQVVTFPANLVPADATSVVFNLTGTGADGPTWLAATGASAPKPATSNVNLVPGETRANLVTSMAGNYFGVSAVTVYSGPAAVNVIVDIAGYYSQSAGSKFTSFVPQRVLDTRTGAPVGPGGTTTLDLSSKVPAGATAAVFNLTGTDATSSTFVTAYPAGQPQPDASNLDLEAGQTAPNLVTVQLSADRKVTLANAHGTVDLIADLAGYYSPDATQVFFPLQPLRALDTRDVAGNPREPLGPGQTRTLELAGWLPAGASTAVYNLTATNVTGSTYLTAWQFGVDRPAASNLNLEAGQTSANQGITEISPDARLNLFNHAGQADVLVDLAGYFALPTPACASACVYTWGPNADGEQANGSTYAIVHQPAVAYGLSGVVTAVEDNHHVYALTSDGTVWGWGRNAVGELGVGRLSGHADTPSAPVDYYSTAPRTVLGLSGITQLRPGLALRNDGTVWTWGLNTMWRLGTGPRDQNYVPFSAVQIPDLTGMTAIAGTPANGYALKSDGTVWAWGQNVNGELGNGLLPGPTACGQGGDLSPDGPNCASQQPVQVQGLTGVTTIADRIAVKSDGTVWQWGGMDANRNPLTPKQVAGLTGVTAVSGSAFDGQYTGTGYALLSDGTVQAWGVHAGDLHTADGCVPYPCKPSATPLSIKGLTGVTALASADWDTGYTLKSDGTVWDWGDNVDGRLGFGGADGHRFTVAQIPVLTAATALGYGGVAVSAG